MAATATVSFPDDKVGLVVIGDPPRNFGGPELADKIVAAVQQVQEAGCSVVVLASDTPGYFVAHWSLQWIVDAFSGSVPRPPSPPAGDRPQPTMVFDFLETLPIISIAANNGQAWGGGAELSWGCDLRIAAQSATYGQPEVALGIIPGAGGTTRLARLIGPTRCMEMILDGRPITAEQALALGAINRVVPDDRLREEAIRWAAHIAQWPAWSLAACKRSLVEGRDLPLGEARRNEGRIFAGVARRPESLQLMRDAQLRYDAGADPYDAIGLPSPGRPLP
ncbi:MAG: enoyl-CoA hydratase/isomerase family protein [Acidimicrobiaceae bacterium]|nr:enoyl-CoA hydratase/isomerase family protein [Acidimicrobiaceae bacterium]